MDNNLIDGLNISDEQLEDFNIKALYALYKSKPEERQNIRQKAWNELKTIKGYETLMGLIKKFNDDQVQEIFESLAVSNDDELFIQAEKERGGIFLFENYLKLFYAKVEDKDRVGANTPGWTVEDRYYYEKKLIEQHLPKLEQMLKDRNENVQPITCREIDKSIRFLKSRSEEIEGKEVPNIKRPIVFLTSEFELKGIKEKAGTNCLDIAQTAILFWYLREHKAILNFSDNSLEKPLQLLTGHDGTNIRKRGFNSLKEHKKEKENLNRVKLLLNAILLELDQDLREAKN